MSDAADLPPTLRPEQLGADAALRDLPRDPEGRPRIGGIPLLCRLGKGGMGIVYYAVHPRLRQEIAVKILPRDVADREPDLVRRFLAEARLAASLSDPHLVRVLDVDQDAGTHYYLMEYVAGESAGARMRRGPVPEQEAVEIVCAATAGLATAHGAGIVHRDVKPDNILIPRGEPGEAKLADLGLAKPRGASGTLATRTGTAMGTPGYMAPEQAEDAKRVGYAADVFSMGATLYALLAGRGPFEREGLAAVLRATALETPAPLPENVGGTTRKIVERCLAKDPKDRYPEARALLEALLCRAVELKSVSPKPRDPLEGAMLLVERRAQLGRQGDVEAVREEELAIEAFGKVLLREPRNVEARLWRGGLLMERAQRGGLADGGDLWRMSRADYHAAIEAAPGDWRTHSNYGNWIRNFVQASEQAGVGDNSKPLLAEAREHLDRAVSLAAGEAAAPHLHRGRIRMLQGDLPGALADLGRAAALEPRTWVIHAERGLVRRLLKDSHGAIEDFDRAIALSPDNVEVLIARAQARGDIEDAEHAATDYARAFELAPQRWDLGGLAVFALETWATQLEERRLLPARDHALETAARRCDLVLQASPRNFQMLELRARIRTRREDYKGALADYDRLLELAPRNPQTYEARAAFHMKVGFWQAAEADYARAFELDPTQAYYLVGRSAARHKRGALAEARADLEEAVRLEPANGLARSCLLQLLQTLKDPETPRLCDDALRVLPSDDPHRASIERVRRCFPG